MAPNKAPLYQVLQDLRQIEWLGAELARRPVEGRGTRSRRPRLYFQMVETRGYAKRMRMFVDIVASVKPKLRCLARRACEAVCVLPRESAEGITLK